MPGYFSTREGLNPNSNGLPLADITELFSRVFGHLRNDGYFDEAFGFYCVDAGEVFGKVKEVDLEILLAVRKKSLWPIEKFSPGYTEDDLFDIIEFLFHHVSQPIEGSMHNYNGCGMHWETFNKVEGQAVFIEKMNSVLKHYKERFELSVRGQILKKPEAGFEPIFNADVPSDDQNVVGRINAAILKFRKHGSTLDDRRHAVRDLADVLEYLKPKVKKLYVERRKRSFQYCQQLWNSASQRQAADRVRYGDLAKLDVLLLSVYSSRRPEKN